MWRLSLFFLLFLSPCFGLFSSQAQPTVSTGIYQDGNALVPTNLPSAVVQDYKGMSVPSPSSPFSHPHTRTHLNLCCYYNKNHFTLGKIDFFFLFCSTQLQRRALNLATSFEEKLCDNHELLHWLVKELKEVRVNPCNDNNLGTKQVIRFVMSVV